MNDPMNDDMSDDHTVDQVPRIAAYGENFRAMWTYWHNLPKQNLMPHLSDYLDNVPPDLQPKVVLLDLTDPAEGAAFPSDITVRLAGTMVTAFTGEITGTNAERLYQGKARSMAIRAAWVAASQPCGYLVSREVRSRFGLVFQSRALILPLRTNTVGSKTILSFNERPPIKVNDVPRAAKSDQVEAVLDYPMPHWLDIGAGTPAKI
ncbi:MAG: PAS domain-containing protein [Rhodospirillaceae bacterium]